MSGAILGLVGVLIGGLITHLGNYWLWKRRQTHQAHQIARGIKGEVQAILRLLEIRDYSGQLRSRAQLTRQSGRFLPYSVPITREYFKVFQANVDRLGLLAGSLPEDVGRWYVLGEGVRENFNVLSNADYGSDLEAEGVYENPAVRRAALEDWAALLEGAADEIDNLIERGEELIERIDVKYPGSPTVGLTAGLVAGLRDRLPGDDGD